MGCVSSSANPHFHEQKSLRFDSSLTSPGLRKYSFRGSLMVAPRQELPHYTPPPLQKLEPIRRRPTAVARREREYELESPVWLPNMDYSDFRHFDRNCPPQPGRRLQHEGIRRQGRAVRAPRSKF